uniref:Uncharacterized protein n=1 Tax=Equus asinus TaxID=9793 RepID=A0A9L0IUQ0_EQUAS
QYHSSKRGPHLFMVGEIPFLIEIHPLPLQRNTTNTEHLLSVQKAIKRKIFFSKFHPGSTKEPHAFSTLRNAKSIDTSEI